MYYVLICQQTNTKDIAGQSAMVKCENCLFSSNVRQGYFVRQGALVKCENGLFNSNVRTAVFLKCEIGLSWSDLSSPFPLIMSSNRYKTHHDKVIPISTISHFGFIIFCRCVSPHLILDCNAFAFVMIHSESQSGSYRCLIASSHSHCLLWFQQY